MTPDQIRLIIKEEISNYLLNTENDILEEGWKDKLTKGLAGLALAGGLGLSGPAQAQSAPTGELTSVERPLNQAEILKSDVKRKLVADFNALKLKDKYNMPVILKTSDSRIDELSKAVADMAISKGHEKGIDRYTEIAVNLIKTGIEAGGDLGPTIDFVKSSFIKRTKKKKLKRTVTSYETRNNPRIIQQAVFGIWIDAQQGKDIGPASDKLTKALVRGIKDKDISKADAKKILQLVSKPNNISKINKILGLQDK